MHEARDDPEISVSFWGHIKVPRIDAGRFLFHRVILDEPHDDWLDQLTPRQIVGELDKYIVGQDDAKKAVAIALRNRWRRQRVAGSCGSEMRP